MDEDMKRESADEVVEETKEVEATAPPEEEAPAPPPPPEEKTQPSFRERRVLERARLQFSDIMQIPVGPDGKEFVVTLQAVDEDTKQIMHSERVLVCGKRPSANEVLLHIVRKL